MTGLKIWTTAELKRFNIPRIQRPLPWMYGKIEKRNVVSNIPAFNRKGGEAEKMSKICKDCPIGKSNVTVTLGAAAESFACWSESCAEREAWRTAKNKINLTMVMKSHEKIQTLKAGYPSWPPSATSRLSGRECAWHCCSHPQIWPCARSDE